MEWLVAHGFRIAVWAFLFWGSIKVLDRENGRNTLALALFVGLVADIMFTVCDEFGFYYFFIFFTIFAVRFVTWHYYLSLLAALVVAAVTEAVPFFVLPRLIASYISHGVTDLDPDSELSRAELVLYGVPILVFACAIAGFVRRRRAGEPEVTIPTASVSRWRRAPSAARAKAEPIPPVIPAAPLRAPAPPAPPPDKPRLLS